ncbi:MAG: hypothetical protein C4562_02350, partial [Actinobacteria bacterium]
MVSQYIKVLVIIFPVVFLILLGFFTKKLGFVKQNHSAYLNQLIVYFTLPALVFTAIYYGTLTLDYLKIPIVSLIIMATISALVFLIFRKSALSRPVLGALILTSAVGNTGYIGYPLALKLAGNQGLVKAIFYDLFGTVLFIL